MPFAGAVALEWQNGSRLEIEGRFLKHGTTPQGSTWARMPMPYSNSKVKPQFEPPCDEVPGSWKTETGVCSGRYLTNVSIVDWLTVPKSTPAGDYVLQLRYDCEESAQICEYTQCIFPPVGSARGACSLQYRASVVHPPPAIVHFLTCV